jgi:hypothetical protein
MGLASRASPVHTPLRNCTGDEGGPFGYGDQVSIPSQGELLRGCPRLRNSLSSMRAPLGNLTTKLP